MLRPILEKKGIIGRIIKATELAKICRQYKDRPPVRSYCALDLAEDIAGIVRGGGRFVFDDLEIQVHHETDFATGRRSPSIEFEPFFGIQDSPEHDQPAQIKVQTVNSVSEKEPVPATEADPQGAAPDNPDASYQDQTHQ